MESIEQLDWHSAAAMLAWQAEMGVTETIAEFPSTASRQRRRNWPKRPRRPRSRWQRKARVAATEVDPVAVARDAASAAADLGALREAMAAFEHCDLKLGAERLVFGDGDPSARLMIVGEAPGRDEDREGRPFVGRAGQLLDRMLAAVGLDRQAKGAEGVYITNVLPWRPPQNRDPKPAEIEMLKPFLDRHIALADPDILVVMGNISAQAMLGRRGITRLRGTWMEALDRPVMPMFHPAYLLRNPAAKREAWADLLDLQAKLKETAS